MISLLHNLMFMTSTAKTPGDTLKDLIQKNAGDYEIDS